MWKYTNGDNREVVNTAGELDNVNSPAIQAWLAQGGMITPANTNATIVENIATLENSTGFTRKQRETILAGSLPEIDRQIAELRTQLA